MAKIQKNNLYLDLIINLYNKAKIEIMIVIKIIKLLKSRWIFKMPKKSDILIFDRVTEKAGFTEIIFKKKNYEVIDVRYESVCLPILINVIFKFGFTRIKENYFAEFIRKVSPKIIYTAIDNNMDFYKLKLLYDKCIYISDQFGISKNAYAAFKGRVKKDSLKSIVAVGEGSNSKFEIWLSLSLK